MKSSLIILSFLLIAEIHQTLGAGENKADATKGAADEVKEKATKEKVAALNNIRSRFNKVKDELKKALQVVQAKKQEDMKIAEMEHLKADVIASAMWRDALHTLSVDEKVVEGRYKANVSAIQQNRKTTQEEHDDALQKADANFASLYTEANEIKQKAEDENKEVLAKGRTQYENAVQSAENKKNEAEGELSQATKNSNSIPLDQWTKIIANYETEMEAYEKALQAADSEWQNVLNSVGIGEQYEEAINAALTELANAHTKVESDTVAAMGQYDEYLKENDRQKNKAAESMKNNKQAAEKQFKAAIEAAENDAKKKYDRIGKKAEQMKTLILLHMEKIENEFQKQQTLVITKFNDAMKGVSTVEGGAEKPKVMA